MDYCLDGQAFVVLEMRHSKAAAQLQRLRAIRSQETPAAVMGGQHGPPASYAARPQRGWLAFAAAHQVAEA
eukprot:8568501-Pyramimonas_sp.AAC.1